MIMKMIVALLSPRPKKLPLIKPLNFASDSEFLLHIIKSKVYDAELLLNAEIQAMDVLFNDTRLNDLIELTVYDINRCLSEQYINDVLLNYFKYDGLLEYVTREAKRQLTQVAFELNRKKRASMS